MDEAASAAPDGRAGLDGLSVVIPTHSGRPSVLESVSALLMQDEPMTEIVVVIDGEGAASRAVLADVRDPRLRILEIPKGGVCAARNHGLAHARYPWVGFVDDDDLPRSTWYSTWRGLMADSVMLCTASVALWRDGVASPRPVTVDPSDRTLAAGTLLAGGFLVRRELLERVHGYDVRLRAAENMDLGLRLANALNADDARSVVATTDEIVIDVHLGEAARSRWDRHSANFAEAADVFLRRHRERLVVDPATHAAYHRIIARSKRMSGDATTARRHAWSAVRLDPANHENYASLLLSLAESVRRTVRRDGLDPQSRRARG